MSTKGFLFDIICYLAIVICTIHICGNHSNMNSLYIKCNSDVCIESIKQDENVNIGKYYNECSPNVNIKGSDLSTKIGWHGKRINYK